MLRLADVLSERQMDRLYWYLVAAVHDVDDELAELGARTSPVRGLLYGPGVLDSYRALRDDLVSLLDTDLAF